MASMLAGWVAGLVIAVAAPAPAAPAGAADGTIREILARGEHPWLRGGGFAERLEDVRGVYAASGYAPRWLRGGRPTAQALEVIAALAEAEERGLSPDDYGATELRRRADDTPGALFDTALTVAVMRYATAAHRGRIDPRAVDFGYSVEPKRLDLGALVAELAASPAPRERLARLDPPFPAFGRLRRALARHRELAAADLPPIPDLAVLHPGDLSPDLAPLRTRLEIYGDLAPPPAAPAADPPPIFAGDPLLYDPALVEAVRRFQRRHGLEPDGIIGKATLGALRVPMRERVEQIVLAMERLRWLPYDQPDRVILVNIPEFRLRGYAAGSDRPAVSMNVVVGEAARQHKTPVLHADMTYLVFRPFWSVPSGIARREILPKLERDPDYLMRNDMEMIEGRIRQRPGRRNSLGLVKFILPNPHHVYLHDTPSKGLFGRSRRDFSHGCIRVADPRALAEFVLGGQDGWTRSRIDRAMTRGPDDRRVDLPSRVPVYIFYTTVVVDEDGTTNFFSDIYDHDFRLENALAKRYQSPP
jgi:murein L,D-transpeptidase YcbB/YkuD